MNKGGFSWKRLTGVTRVKGTISRATGIPLTKSGRQRKVGKALTGDGCMVVIAIVLGAAAAVFALVASVVRA